MLPSEEINVAVEISGVQQTVGSLNKYNIPRFPVREDFYNVLDKVYDPKKRFYHEDFDKLLDVTYGENPDPFETGEFNW